MPGELAQTTVTNSDESGEFYRHETCYVTLTIYDLVAKLTIAAPNISLDPRRHLSRMCPINTLIGVFLRYNIYI